MKEVEEIKSPDEGGSQFDWVSSKTSNIVAEMDALFEAAEASAQASEGQEVKREENKSVPWERAAENVRNTILRVATVKDEIKAAQDDLEKAIQGQNEISTKLVSASEAANSVEKKYGEMRIFSEKSALMEGAVDRMRGQAKFYEQKENELLASLDTAKTQNAAADEVRDANLKALSVFRAKIEFQERRLKANVQGAASVEDVMALRRTCARHAKELEALRMHLDDPAHVKHLPIPPCADADKSSADKENARVEDPELLAVETMHGCWRSLRDVQKGLILERAGCELVDIDDTKAQILKEQAKRTQALTDSCDKLHAKVEALLRDAAPNSAQEAANGQTFASVAMARFVGQVADMPKSRPTVEMSVGRGVHSHKLPSCAPKKLQLSSGIVDLDVIHHSLIQHSKPPERIH